MYISIVRGTILEGKQEQLREVFDFLTRESLKESGCRRYEAYIDGTRFLAVEEFEQRADLDAHLQTEHMASHGPRLKECVEGGMFDVQAIETDNVTALQV